jgi:hypothetical protein
MQRTNTTQQTTFELPLPQAATFDFSAVDGIKIHVPTDSKFKMVHHWHYQRPDTTRIIGVHGRMYLMLAERGKLGSSLDAYLNPPFELSPKLDDAIAWSPVFTDPPQSPLTVMIVANRVLHRNICSAILDRDLFPQLQTTPQWFKVLWRMSSDSRRCRLLDSALRLQLEVIFYKHDYHFVHGRVPFTDLFWPDNTPGWAKKWEMRSMLLFSRTHETTSMPPSDDRCTEQLTCFFFAAYWKGRGLYGMKGGYAEYTPREEVGETKIVDRC